jgi:cellulose biosynthesis protein BcsQ
VSPGELVDVGAKVAIPATGAVALWAVRKYMQLLRLRRRCRSLERDRDQLRARLDGRADVGTDLTEELERRTEAEAGLRAELAATEAARDAARAVADDAQGKLQAVQRQLDEAEARWLSVTRHDGRIWFRPLAPDAVPFRSRAARRMTVVSVLNLKGGVGKTTITANLAATLGRQGKAVLMIDLDYQRSLSMLLLEDHERALLHYRERSLQHFLAAPDHGPARLLRCAAQVGPGAPNCAIVTNSDTDPDEAAADTLEETENRLMAEWLVNRSGPDIRLFLRAALHGPTFDGPYQYVLLDCPPRLTTACVNALAASDFVLVPAIPDTVSTRAVDNLVRSLGRFKREVFPQLELLGVVPNMVAVRNGGPIRQHEDELRRLRELGRVSDPGRLRTLPFPVFRSVIPDDNAFGRCSAGLRPGQALELAVSDDRVGETFRALADELEQEIRHHASRRTATVPA